MILVTGFLIPGGPNLRGRSLITGRGVQVMFYPYEMGGQKRFSHANGGGGGKQTVLRFDAGQVLAMLKGGAKSFHPGLT